MTSRSRLTVLTTTDRVTVVCLSGELDDEACAHLAREMEEPLRRAALRGRRLVLDLTGARTVSAAVRRILRQATDHLDHEPLPVVAPAPSIREALEHPHIAGIGLHDSLAGALAALPRPPATRDTPRASGSGPLPVDTEDLPGEVFGMRAKARSSGLIGIAQGLLIERYDLPGPAAAFALLREGSQHFNVPVRVLASAVITAPRPQTPGVWFPGRATHAPPPATGFLHSYGVDPTDRRQVLTCVLQEAVELSDADAGELHLADPAQDDALVLEQHHGLHAAYWDQVALVGGPPPVCAQAHLRGEPVTVVDVAADTLLSAHPAGRALLEAGSHAVHSTPLTPAGGRGSGTGTLTVHRNPKGSWLTDHQERALVTLAAELADWCSWYRRTVVLDALEYLHQHH
jgi:anti-anti-sigma regulatory factor